MSDSGIVHVYDNGQLSLQRANRLLAGLGGNELYRAVGSAISRAAQHAKTNAGRFAAEEYTISKGTFMSHSVINSHLLGGSGSVSKVTVTFAGSVIPLLQFKTSYNRNGGVNVSVKKGGGGNIARAFVANIGGTAVYERIAKGRYSIERKYGPSTAHMMQNETVIEKMDKDITETFDKRIEHEITRVLNGWGG